jgi:hypothetical protein
MQIDVHYVHIYIFARLGRQAENDGNCCLFGRFGLILAESSGLL